MTHYSIEPSTRKYVKRYRFLPFVRNLSNKYEKKLNTALDDLKTAPKEVVSKAAKVTRWIHREQNSC